MNKLLTFIIFLLLSGLSYSNATAGERLEYQVKVAGVDFGTGVLFKKDKKLYGELKTNSKWGSVYAVDNSMASWIGEAKTPKRTEIDFRMRGKHTRFDFTYPTQKTVKITKWRPHRKPQKYAVKHQTAVYDFLSMIEDIRKSFSFEKRSYSIITGRRIYDVNFTQVKEEDITTPVGVKKAVLYSVIATRPGSFRQEMRVWFEKSPDAVPLKLVGNTKLGMFEVSLVKRLLEGSK